MALGPPVATKHSGFAVGFCGARSPSCHVFHTSRQAMIKTYNNPSPPRMGLSLAILSEYRIQHGANGPLYVTSSYSTWIFCRGVSGFATDCPCGVWCRGLTTCLLHVGPPFGNRILNNSWAIGLTYWIIYLTFLSWHSILMCNKSTSAGTSLEGTPMFAHVTLHRTFNSLGSKCPWWQDVEIAS